MLVGVRVQSIGMWGSILGKNFVVFGDGHGKSWGRYSIAPDRYPP